MVYWARILEDRLIPADRPSEEEHKKLPIGTVCQIKVIKPRSKKHLGLFFASVQNAFENWPERDEFQPESSEHLRQWLTCKAGYRDIAATQKLDGREGSALSTAELLAPAITSAFSRNKWPFIIAHNGSLCVVTAKSIAFDKISERDFAPVSQAVSDVLKIHTGIGLDEFKKEAGKAA